MQRIVLILVFLLYSLPLQAQGEPNKSQSTADSDPRQFVSMPAQARKFMREEMMEHLVTLNQIIGYLSENNLEAAADIAESKMGRSSMGKHRGTGMGPGRFMPLEMRNIGWSMHDAASEFAEVAKQGDVKQAYTALQKVMNSCIACHYAFRTQ